MFKPVKTFKDFKDTLNQVMQEERQECDIAWLNTLGDPNSFIKALEKKMKRLKDTEDAKGKKVLVIGECGYGDCIWLYRYVKVLCKIAREVHFLVGAPLVPLFRKDKKICGLKNLHIVSEHPSFDFDYICWSFDLPVLFDFKIYYAKLPYLNTGDVEVDEDSIGIALGNEDTEEGAQYRNFPLEYMKEFKRKGTTLYNFSDRKSKGCRNIYGTFRNFLSTARKLKKMKYFICTDCVMLNLAGALGVPTYALFNYDFWDEWIWHLYDGKSIKWYGSVKPFVGEAFEDWDTAVGRALEAIETDLTNPE